MWRESDRRRERGTDGASRGTDGASRGTNVRPPAPGLVRPGADHPRPGRICILGSLEAAPGRPGPGRLMSLAGPCRVVEAWGRRLAGKAGRRLRASGCRHAGPSAGSPLARSRTHARPAASGPDGDACTACARPGRWKRLRGRPPVLARSSSRRTDPWTLAFAVGTCLPHAHARAPCRSLGRRCALVRVFRDEP